MFVWDMWHRCGAGTLRLRVPTQGETMKVFENAQSQVVFVSRTRAKDFLHTHYFCRKERNSLFPKRIEKFLMHFPTAGRNNPL